jgi:colanic acid/amylovoran biosynthesis glycosyltransferase
VTGGVLRVGYVLNRFPRLSQTFVLNEILELERQGIEVEVYSLLRPPPELRHPALADMAARVTYLPGLDQFAGLELGDGLQDHPQALAAMLQDRAADPLFAGLTAADGARLEVAAACLASLARARGIGHLHAHFGTNQATVALLAARLTGLHFSWTAHARDLFLSFGGIAADREMRRIKVREARFVAAVSQYNRTLLTELAPERGADIHCIYNGIDLARIQPAGAAPAGEILAVGRLVEKKGFADLIAACAHLAAAGAAFHCHIIGEGPLEAALRASIQAHGLEDRVRLLGPMTQPEVFAAMQRASMVVLPCVVADDGDRDGLPTVLIEAMAHALPVVSCPVTGVPEIVEDGITGLLGPSRDAAALAAMIGLLIADPASAAAMGRAGRRRAERLFDLSRNVERLAVLFDKAARRGQPAMRVA